MDVVKVACPDPLSVPVPSVVFPSTKVTVPAGVPVAGDTALTVAMKVTDCPYSDGLVEEVTVVRVSDWVPITIGVPPRAKIGIYADIVEPDIDGLLALFQLLAFQYCIMV